MSNLPENSPQTASSRLLEVFGGRWKIIFQVFRLFSNADIGKKYNQKMRKQLTFFAMLFGEL